MDTPVPSSSEQPSIASPTSIVPPAPKKSVKKTVIIIVLVLLFAVSAYAYLFLKQSKQSMNHYSPSPANHVANISPTRIHDTTASWKTYSNSKFNYSFKIPSSYFTGECEDGKTLLISSTVGGIGCQKGVSGLVLSVILPIDPTDVTKSIAALKRDYTIVEKSIVIDGVTGMQYEGTLKTSPAPLPNHVISSVFTKNNKTYMYSYWDYNNGIESSLYLQILSTFKFIEHIQNDPGPTAGLPVYRPSTYVGQAVAPTCQGETSGFSICNANTFTWETLDDFDTVNSWYRKINGDWMCSGGAGSYGGPRDATAKMSCKRDNENQDVADLWLTATATKTEIKFVVPNK